MTKTLVLRKRLLKFFVDKSHTKLSNIIAYASSILFYAYNNNFSLLGSLFNKKLGVFWSDLSTSHNVLKF